MLSGLIRSLRSCRGRFCQQFQHERKHINTAPLDFQAPPVQSASFCDELIKSYAERGQFAEILQLYDRMKNRGIVPEKQSYPSILKACAALRDLDRATHLHSLISDLGFDSDKFVGSALVSMYNRLGFPDSARQVFDKIPTPDIVSWNALLSGCAQARQWNDALSVFSSMQIQGIGCDGFTVATLLSVCSNTTDLQNAKALQGLSIKRGFTLDPFVNTSLIDAYGKCADLHSARLAFMASTKGVACCNAMIAAFLHNRLSDDALRLFWQMRNAGSVPNAVTIASVVSACTACTEIDVVSASREVHQYAVKTGMVSDAYVGSALVGMYANLHAMDDAVLVFRSLSNPHSGLWSCMISVYVQNGKHFEALKLFAEAAASSSPMAKQDSVRISTIVSVVGHLRLLRLGREIHGFSIRNGFNHAVEVASAIITMYSKCSQTEDACTVFHSIPNKDKISWSAVVTGLVQSGYYERGVEYFSKMRGIVPDSNMIAGVLPACAQLKDIKRGKEIHNLIAKIGMWKDVFVASALLDMYAKCGELEMARKVFDDVPRKNVVTWNAMITAFSQRRNADEALRCFREMQLQGVKSNCITMVGVLPACSCTAALQQGKETHAHVCRRGMHSDPYVAGALIDMYAKCGALEAARRVFDGSWSFGGVTVWNVMISAYGMHGRGQEALRLYDDMVRKGLPTDRITFVSVLFACSHAGMVEEGRKVFDKMEGRGVEAGMEHYSCMVDLLGRAGMVDEAYALIRSMAMDPDAMVWGALLSACKEHCNVEVGEIAGNSLLAAEPGCCSHYVLLSNLYASAGRWDDMARVMGMMRERGLKKSAGWSWIKVRDQVHTFVSGDTSHPQAPVIYALLQSLYDQMKDVPTPVQEE